MRLMRCVMVSLGIDGMEEGDGPREEESFLCFFCVLCPPPKKSFVSIGGRTKNGSAYTI